MLLLTIALSCQMLLAQEKTFVKEYTYKAGEMDSKISCRAIAVSQLRSTLLQEIGVYVESEQLLKTSDVSGKFSQDFVENIATISAGITKLEVLEEKWNGETFWMKAAITIDPKSLEQSLKQLVNDRQKVKELETLKKQLEEAKNTLAILTKTTNGRRDGNRADTLQRNYNKEIGIINATEFIYSGTSKHNHQDYMGAIIDFNRAMQIDPNYAEAYNCRGIARTGLGEYWAAITDFTKAIEINPRYAWAYNNRGVTKSHLNDNRGAIADYAKAIEIDPNIAAAYINRGVTKAHLNDNWGSMPLAIS